MDLAIYLSIRVSLDISNEVKLNELIFYQLNLTLGFYLKNVLRLEIW